MWFHAHGTLVRPNRFVPRILERGMRCEGFAFAGYYQRLG
jgi:hypothetical protein